MSGAEPLRCLSAVSAILDLANGLEDDKSLLTGLFAFELARDSGLGDGEVRAAFFAGMLRHLGCTAYAAVESGFNEDDIGLRSRLLRSDPGNRGDVLRAAFGGNHGLGARLRGALRLIASASRVRAEWTREACGAAHLLAEQLGLGSGVVAALDEVFEQWDGKGGPHGKGGSELSAVGRVANAAHIAVTFWLHGGIDAARDVLAIRAGGVLDPQIAGRAGSILTGFAATNIDVFLAEVDSALAADPLPVSVKTIAVTFGDFGDLQSPFTRGHSRRVAAAAERAALALGLPAGERESLSLAAHLHDLGQVAVSTGVWMRPVWSGTDRERARLHPLFTERVLAGAPPLAEAAKLAGAHHELLDGSGYHRGAAGPGLPRAARILAATEVYCGLQEERPHRAAMTPAETKGILEMEARSGRLDADAVAALLGRSERRAASAGPTGQLTARERDVLRLLAHGRTNKEIAAALSISDRTVQHHTIHIYEKLGVDTRAGAALLAARHGLV